LKRFLAVTLVLCLFCSFIGTTLAANYTIVADTLYSLGLFKGTDNGYQLDRAPTRAEASVMLVRFLGQEQSALSNTAYSAPYNDVPNWAKPYVQYLYDNKLTKGVNDTLFGSQSSCSAQMYLTFILRSLGYVDGIDFNYSEAIDFSLDIGLTDDYILQGEFTRGSMTAISLLALTVAPKTTTYSTLSEKLHYDGVFSAPNFVIRCNEFAKVRNAMKSLSDSTCYDVSVNYTFTNNSYFDAFLESHNRFKYNNGYFSLYNEEYNTSYYWKDNYFYVNENGYKYRVPMSYESATEQLSIKFEMDDAVNFLSNYTSDDAEPYFAYAISYSEPEYPFIAATLLGDDYLSEYPELVVNDIVSEILLSPGGVLHRQNTSMRGEYTNPTTGAREFLQVIEEIIVNSSSNVTVVFPADLDSYPLL